MTDVKRLWTTKQDQHCAWLQLPKLCTAQYLPRLPRKGTSL
jgi:hypothetical protein